MSASSQERYGNADQKNGQGVVSESAAGTSDVAERADRELGSEDVVGADDDEDELSPEEDKRILRRIDTCLLPILAISYMLQFLDKQAMNYTAILGLRPSLHLHGQDYAWAGSIFYLGYLAASYPVARALVRFPLGRTLAASMAAWSVVLLCTAATTSAAGLQATRFFLGVCEAAVAPGFSLVTAAWWRRAEQPARHGAWFMGNVAAGLFGAVLAWAVGHVDNPAIEAWRVVFLVFGGVTLVWSGVVWWGVPDAVGRAWFLPREGDGERAVRRVRGNLGVAGKRGEWRGEQVWEAVRDPQSWLFVVIQFCGQIPNGGVTNFAAIVVNGLGFTVFQTLLIGMIGTAFQATFVLLSSGGATLFRNTRTYWLVWNFVISLVGVVMVREIPVDGGIWSKFAGYCLLLAFSANFPIMLSLTAANVGGFTKRNTVNAMMFVSYCVGNVAGPQLFFAREAPTYKSGFLAMLVCFVAGIVFSLALRFYYIWENGRRDASAAAAGDEGTGGGDAEAEERRQDAAIMLNSKDQTDGELAGFRYVY